MPIFNVITVDESHLAKVNARRSELILNDNFTDTEVVGMREKSFQAWRRYISSQSNQRVFTSILINRIVN